MVTKMASNNHCLMVFTVFFLYTLCTLNRVVLFNQQDTAKTDSVWLPKLGHERHGGFCIAYFWIMNIEGSRPPYDEDIQPGLGRCSCQQSKLTCQPSRRQILQPSSLPMTVALLTSWLQLHEIYDPEYPAKLFPTPTEWEIINVYCCLNHWILR